MKIIIFVWEIVLLCWIGYLMVAYTEMHRGFDGCRLYFIYYEFL